MPLVHVDVLDGRTPAEIPTLLDAVHVAVVEAFEVPERDRCQVARSHPGELTWRSASSSKGERHR